MLEDVTRRDRRDLELLRMHREHADHNAHDELVRRYVPLVRSFARRYAERGEELEDLVQVGMVGLVKAINRFDLDTGRRFITFAAPNITGEIKRHFRDCAWAVHVPRGMKELQAKVLSERAAASAEGRTLTTTELADRLGVGEREAVEAVRAAECFRADSLEFPAGEDRQVLDTLGSGDPGYAAVDRRDQVADAMRALTPRQRLVVEKRFDEELLQREIGQQVGVSQMQVSRILDQSVRAMREHLDQGADAPLAA
jgi:RNA polymerase sigma-B factor